jgi:hypothetical protein
MATVCFLQSFWKTKDVPLLRSLRRSSAGTNAISQSLSVPNQKNRVSLLILFNNLDKLIGAVAVRTMRVECIDKRGNQAIFSTGVSVPAESNRPPRNKVKYYDNGVVGASNAVLPSLLPPIVDGKNEWLYFNFAWSLFFYGFNHLHKRVLRNRLSFGLKQPWLCRN